jgi:hypothetical protein
MQIKIGKNRVELCSSVSKPDSPPAFVSNTRCIAQNGTRQYHCAVLLRALCGFFTADVEGSFSYDATVCSDPGGPDGSGGLVERVQQRIQGRR